LRPAAHRVRIVCLGDAVMDGAYRVHTRFDRVVNMTDGPRLVALAREGLDAGPLTIILRGLDTRAVRALHVEGTSITLDGRLLPLGGARLYRSRIDVDVVGSRLLPRNLAALRSAVVSLAPPLSLAFLLDARRLEAFRPGFERRLAAHVRDCVRDVLFGDVLRGVGRLAGSGSGLTPAGDDFIAGLLVAMNLIERAHMCDLSAEREAIFRAARTDNVVSDAHLRLSRDGRVFESMRDLLIALACGDTSDVRGRAERLMAVGSTSGADTAVGLLAGLSSRRWRVRVPGAAPGRPPAPGRCKGEPLWS
jgi:hypothetical protein